MKFTEAIKAKNKNKVLALAEKAKACNVAYIEFYQAKTKQDRINIICDNLTWLFAEQIITKIDLPEGLEVGGYLDLYKTEITSLPEGLKVGGDLNLYRTKITSLPEGLEVWGYIYKNF